MTPKEILDSLGWRVDNRERLRDAVVDFQFGWNLGPRLATDGIVGPKTSAALKESRDRLDDRKSTASAHFSFTEFRCKCGGRFADCRRIWVERNLIHGLEEYRKRIGGPVQIISGCRCNGHNRKVGGATRSRHRYGDAADLAPRLSVAGVRSLERFTGMGSKDGMVTHVDTRPGSPRSPALWRY